MEKAKLKQLVKRLIDEDKAADACLLIDAVKRQNRIMWDMQEASSKALPEKALPEKALSDLIDELNEGLSKVIREAISVSIGETLSILRDKGIFKND